MGICSEHGFAFPAHSVSAKTTIHGCTEHVIHCHGISYSFASSDQGTIFTVNEDEKGMLGRMKSICKDQEHKQAHRGREGRDTFGDCQRLRPGCSADTCWGAMGIEATSLVVMGKAERNTYFILWQVDLTSGPWRSTESSEVRG